MSLEELKEANKVIERERTAVNKAKVRIDTAESLLNNKSNNVGLLIAVFIIISGIILMGMTISITPEKEYVPIIIKEQPIIAQIIQIERHENIIVGDKVMTCIGAPNATRLNCYREKEKK